MLDSSNIYYKQVQLLLEVLPYINNEECFALKGGTAINLFVRDMPRLSVDIDLTYLPIADRDQSLAAIDDALRRIGARIKTVMKGITVTVYAGLRGKIFLRLGPFPCFFALSSA